jgi:ubiquinone biosynthesis protein UbiJ
MSSSTEDQFRELTKVINNSVSQLEEQIMKTQRIFMGLGLANLAMSCYILARVDRTLERLEQTLDHIGKGCSEM